jgi:hypothetical protein
MKLRRPTEYAQRSSGPSSVRRISSRSSGVTRSSASMTKIQSCAARSIA